MSELKMVKQAYQDLVVPDTLRYTTGPEETNEIARITNEYFERTISVLRLSQKAIEIFVSVEYRTLGVEEPMGMARVTDDFDASLWLNEVQPLVSVRNVRDVSNFQVVLFSKYSLVETADMTLQGIYELQGSCE